MIEETKCPICDGQMASRANRATGQRFWGCKRYPVCKGTRNTDGEARPSSYREALEGEEDYETYSNYEKARRNDRDRWRS